MRLFSLGFALVCGLAGSFLACSSDTPGADPSDGGTAADGAPLPGDGGSTEAACAALPAKEELAPIGASLFGRAGIGAGGVVMLDRQGGNDTGNTILTKTGSLELYPKTGGAASTFYAPEGARSVESFYVSGNDVFVLVSEIGVAKSARIFRKSFGDAAATAIGTTAYATPSAIAAVDATHLYLVTPGAPGSYTVARIDRATGAATTVADLPSTMFAQTQVHDGFVWFYTIQGAGKLYKAPVAGGGATLVSDTTCPAGLTVSASGIYCGGIFRLTKRDAAFENPLVLFDTQPLKDTTAPEVAGMLGSDLVVVTSIPAKARTNIFGVPQAGGPYRPLVCDVGNVTFAHVDGDYVYFADERATGGEAPTKKLWRARVR